MITCLFIGVLINYKSVCIHASFKLPIEMDNNKLVTLNIINDKTRMIRITKKAFKHIGIILYFMFYCASVITFAFQNQLIFMAPKDYKLTDRETPFARIETSEKNSELKIYVKNNNSETDLIFFHGRAMSVNVLNKITEGITSYNVIYYYCRGYENGTFVRNKKNIMDDVSTLAEFVYSRPKRKMVVFGQSFGCHFALYFTTLMNRDLILVLENPFYSLRSVIQYQFSLPLYLLLVYDYRNAELLKRVKNKIFYFYRTTTSICLEGISLE
ncbi:carboxylesterase [Trachipleistophora hominis]|uniref:Carboxylesterase n=1 Tax=Trachipleistophora hominis TaxID=72359 RepID=L7JXR9_TRAHO|nr:carboxylesterase [Trachipleistophora hominis]